MCSSKVTGKRPPPLPPLRKLASDRSAAGAKVNRASWIALDPKRNAKRASLPKNSLPALSRSIRFHDASQLAPGASAFAPASLPNRFLFRSQRFCVRSPFASRRSPIRFLLLTLPTRCPCPWKRGKGFLEGRRRDLGDKALFSYLIVTLQEKRREEKRRGEEKVAACHHWRAGAKEVGSTTF